jgi:hypothetical protein
MNLKASDLPESTKRNMLSFILSRIGSEEYTRLVKTMGEDQLIDSYLRRVQKVQSQLNTCRSVRSPHSPKHSPVVETNTQKVRKALKYAFESTVTISPFGLLKALALPTDGLLTGFVLFIWIVIIGPLNAFLILVAAFIIFFLFSLLWDFLKAPQASWIIKTSVILGVGGAAGYGIWVGGQWILQGIVQWWGWLGGQFGL